MGCDVAARVHVHNHMVMMVTWYQQCKGDENFPFLGGFEVYVKAGVGFWVQYSF